MELMVTHPSSVSSLRSSTPSPGRVKALQETASGMIEGSILALSIFAAQIHLVPLFAAAGDICSPLCHLR